MLGGLVKSVAGLLGVLALATWAGPLHPAADTLAVIRLPLVAAFALAVIWTDWPRVLRWPLAGLCLLVLGQAVAMKLVSPEPGSFVVYQKNLWHGNPQVAALAADILAHGPDVITLQEVSIRNRILLDRLRAEYPYQHLCPFSGWNGLAVLSRHPAVAGGTLCSQDRGLAGLWIAMPEGLVWVLSVHLHWPWPHGQRPQANRLKTLFTGLRGPVVLSGDFNMMPWGSDVRRLAAATGTRRVGPMRPTYWLDLGRVKVPLPIDQVYASGGGRAESRPLIGSDHAGIVARVWLDED